jgi:lantibiotic modifying enzyme
MHTADGVVVGRVETGALAQSRERLGDADEEDLAWQRELVRASFRMALEPPPGPAEEGDRWRRHSAGIGESLERLALRHGHGVSWLTLGPLTSEVKDLTAALHPMPWLYSGAAGTALFLAALTAQGGGRRYAELARGALDYAVWAAQWLTDRDEYRDRLPAHGVSGVFSVVYALAECGRLLGDEALLHRARRLALGLAPALRGAPFNPELINGTAATILALLHMHRLAPDDRLLEEASRLGAETVRRQETGTDAGGWQAPGLPRPCLGLGHGAAGIACALVALHAAAGGDGLLAAAARALDFERAHFSAADRDWPNLQADDGALRLMAGWCAGAAGAGLARLAMRGRLADRRLDDEIEVALKAARRWVGTGSHNLCCGEASRVLFFVEAARRLDRPELLADARRGGAAMLDCCAREGYWKLQRYCERSILPGLMDGVAGVGLALLALSDPSRASGVLLLA